ncbi:MAG: transglycosylase SLT domain-containing protein [Acidobacteria bacterium]|nr:transglycosylase SLT domain-containing protein [Acidobacteriota bacterium]
MRKERFFLFLAIFIIPAILLPYYQLDDIENLHTKIKADLAAGKNREVLINLNKIKLADSRIYDLNNYPFLEAIVYRKLGNEDQASRLLAGLAEENSVLSDYILYYLAEINIAKNPELALQTLKKLIARHQDSLLINNAYMMIADVYEYTGDYSDARRYLMMLEKRSRVDRNEAKFKRAVIFEKEGKYKDAADIYFSLLKSNRQSDVALQSLENLEALEKKTKNSYYDSLTSIYQRGMTAFVNRSYELAAKYFVKIYKSNSPNNQHRDDALYYLSRTYERSERYQLALTYYKKLISSYRGGQWERRGLYQLGRVYYILGDERNAAATMKYLVQKFPRSDQALMAYFLLFQNAVAREDYKTALNYSAIIIKKYSGSKIARTVLLEKAVLQYQSKNYREALNNIESLLNKRHYPSSFRAELKFWKAKAYESMNDIDRAREQFLDIIMEHPNDFYRFLAEDKLKIYFVGHKKVDFLKQLNKAKADITRGRMIDARRELTLILSVCKYPDILKEARDQARFIYSRNGRRRDVLNLKAYDERPVLMTSLNRSKYDPHFLKSAEFAFLGLYDLAAAEFQKFRARDYSDMDKLYTLSMYYTKARNPNRAIFWAESLVQLLGSDVDYRILPNDFARMLYPNEFESIVESFSSERKIDKYFVLALIREESKFKADAKSPAAARGLMQFIPSTARDIAAELGLEQFELDSLYQPEFSINLGTQYLSNLMQEFRNNPVHVLSAYNSGERNTERWKSRCLGEEPEEFIARIDYTETRNYVKRVMASFRTYHSINSAM